MLVHRVQRLLHNTQTLSLSILLLLGHADHVGGVKALKLAVPGAQCHQQKQIMGLRRGAHNSNDIYDDAQSQTFSLHRRCSLIGTAQFKIMKLLVTLLVVLFWWVRAATGARF